MIRKKLLPRGKPIGVELEIVRNDVSVRHFKGEKMKKRITRSMHKTKAMLKQKGLTTVEYAVGGALITLAVVGAFTGLGNAVLTVITDITAALP